MSTMKYDSLSCNHCWTSLVDSSAVLTTCSHLYCLSCARSWFRNRNDCSVCSKSLDISNDLEEISFQQTTNISRLMYGLRPSKIIEIANGAIKFWDYHTKMLHTWKDYCVENESEKNKRLERQNQDLEHQLQEHHGNNVRIETLERDNISLKKAYQDAEAQSSQFQKKCTKLEQLYGEISRQLQGSHLPPDLIHIKTILQTIAPTSPSIGRSSNPGFLTSIPSTPHSSNLIHHSSYHSVSQKSYSLPRDSMNSTAFDNTLHHHQHQHQHHQQQQQQQLQKNRRILELTYQPQTPRSSLEDNTFENDTSAVYQSGKYGSQINFIASIDDLAAQQQHTNTKSTVSLQQLDQLSLYQQQERDREKESEQFQENILQNRNSYSRINREDNTIHDKFSNSSIVGNPTENNINYTPTGSSKFTLYGKRRIEDDIPQNGSNNELIREPQRSRLKISHHPTDEKIGLQRSLSLSSAQMMTPIATRHIEDPVDQTYQNGFSSMETNTDNIYSSNIGISGKSLFSSTNLNNDNKMSLFPTLSRAHSRAHSRSVSRGPMTIDSPKPSSTSAFGVNQYINTSSTFQPTGPLSRLSQLNSENQSTNAIISSNIHSQSKKMGHNSYTSSTILQSKSGLYPHSLHHRKNTGGASPAIQFAQEPNLYRSNSAMSSRHNQTSQSLYGKYVSHSAPKTPNLGAQSSSINYPTYQGKGSTNGFLSTRSTSTSMAMLFGKK